MISWCVTKCLGLDLKPSLMKGQYTDHSASGAIGNQCIKDSSQ
jgi:hypothetical protein